MHSIPKGHSLYFVRERERERERERLFTFKCAFAGLYKQRDEIFQKYN